MCMDSASLYRKYRIKPAGTIDFELLITKMLGNQKYWPGLKKCIMSYCKMLGNNRMLWMNTKNTGRKLFAPELEGSISVFKERPISELVTAYSIADPMLLPELYELAISSL